MQVESAEKRSSPRRLRWLIVGTAMIVTAIVVTNAAVIKQLYQSTSDDVQTDLLRQSLTLSELTERTLQAVDLVVATVVEKTRLMLGPSGDMTQLQNEAFHALLKEKVTGLSQIHVLAIVDADGRRINESRFWPTTNPDLSDREYFRALKGNPKLTSYLSEPMRGIRSGGWIVVIARPILDRDERFLGLVFASIDMACFVDLFRSTSLGDGYAATLVRRDGTLLARYPQGGQIGTIIPASVLPLLSASRSAVSRSMSPVDGEARLAAGYSLANYPLVVIVTQTEEAAFAAWRRSAITMCLIAATMIGTILVAVWLIARSWRQQERLNAARAEIVETDKVRALAEAELVRQRDLAAQSKRFAAAVENVAFGLAMFDKDKRLVLCNEAFAAIYRLPDHLRQRGTAFTALLAYRFRDGISKSGHADPALQQQLAVLAALPLERESTRVDEHDDGRQIRVSRRPLPGGGWISTHEDITQQRRAEQELDETKRFLDSIIENIPIAVVVKEAATGKYVLVNRSFQSMIGIESKDLLGKTVFDLYNKKTAAFINKADQDAVHDRANAKFQEYDVDTPYNGPRVFSTSRMVIPDRDGNSTYLVVLIEDVTERRKSEQRIAFMAHHDALTGLANRAAITQRIEEAAARQRRWGEPFTVLLLDLDRFKQVNDTLGHSAGDALLRETALRLKEFLGESDVLARLGGDEFAIIQSGAAGQREAAGQLADRIIGIIAKPFNIDGNEVNIGTSIGISLAPEHGTNPDSLLKMADMALYSAKAAGRNGYRLFDPDMGAAADARLALESELRRALQQRELELHYQPIVDTKTLRICGAEALLRWQHPTKGLITPDQFLPLAEDTGMIGQIGEWVLRTACADAAKWPANVKLAVNLSPLQFHKMNLPDVVMDAVDRAKLPPDRLELEITETALIESGTECLPALRRFKSAGISIALDDFGTGYSSLSQLMMFPFDKIKIDKSFTQNLTKRVECAAIVSAVLTLAQNLDIPTTAEGVESRDQYQLLKIAGVTSVQGYFFQRPCRIAEIDFDVTFAPPVANVA